MRLGFVALIIGLLTMGGIGSAQAKPFWEESDDYARSYTVKRPNAHKRSYSHKRSGYASRRVAYRHTGVGPRPRKWCGWWMRTQLGGGPEFNLARNWRRWGRPVSGPQVGAVVVWSGHVGMITGRSANGKWIVKSGNDGGRVRERARSVAGAVFRVG